MRLVALCSYYCGHGVCLEEKYYPINIICYLSRNWVNAIFFQEGNNTPENKHIT